MVTNTHDIAIGNCTTLHALPLIFDSVGRTHIRDEILPIDEFDQGVLTGNVRVLNRQITRLFTAPNDVAILIYGERLPLVSDQKCSPTDSRGL